MTYKAEIIREVNGVIIKEPRKIIKFENGYYGTNDKDEVAFIKRHVDFSNGKICVDESDDIQNNQKEASPSEMKIIEEHRGKGRPKKVS